MCDECTNASNREQLAICIRWVDDQLQPHEDFIGLYQLDETNADFITRTIKDTLVRLELTLSRCRGKCYDQGRREGGFQGFRKPLKFLNTLLKLET